MQAAMEKIFVASFSSRQCHVSPHAELPLTMYKNEKKIILLVEYGGYYTCTGQSFMRHSDNTYMGTYQHAAPRIDTRVCSDSMECASESP